MAPHPSPEPPANSHPSVAITQSTIQHIAPSSLTQQILFMLHTNNTEDGERRRVDVLQCELAPDSIIYHGRMSIISTHPIVIDISKWHDGLKQKSIQNLIRQYETNHKLRTELKSCKTEISILRHKNSV
eukprot:407329_1